MRIQLSDRFSYGRLLRFTLPSILMMIFTSIYGVVDGLFVSNFTGKTPFAAVNIIWPFLMIVGSMGFMIGTGGTAIVSKTMGEGKQEKANQIFSMLVAVTVLLGVALTVASEAILPWMARMLGATEEMVPYCVLYGRIMLIGTTPFMLQNVFQSFMITAEKPTLGLIITVAAGVTNMALDWLMVGVLPWGVAGAAMATVISQLMGGVIPLCYVARPNSGRLHLTRFRWDGRALLKTCTNGSSELMSNLSMSLINILYNYQLMRLAGEDGVAAYGTMMYVNMVFLAVFLGYSIGAAPVIGYHYGAGNHDELKSLLRKSLVVISVFAIAMLAASELTARPLTAIFVGYDGELHALTCHGFRIYSLSFLLSGFAIFGSSFFTALNNGAVSAAISFLRTLVFQVIAVLLLPMVFGVDGIWLSIVVAEALAVALTAFFLIRLKGRYHYA